MGPRRRWIALGLALPVLNAESVEASTGVEASEARAEPAVSSSRVANYAMDVRLDEPSRTLDGQATLRWTNATEHATDELFFHLYWNAWRNDQSSFFRSVRYSGRSLDDVRSEDWAYQDLRALRLLGDGEAGIDLLGSARFVQPDDGNEQDRTVLHVPLPRRVAPGETITVELAWKAKVPRTFARTGVRGDYYFVAQWFPKIGVFEADGRWNCHQFIQTEFYADFGSYDVWLTVPDGWVVGATGRQVETRDNGDGTIGHRFRQDDVHDFAWTTSPRFRVHEARFEHETLPPVDMRLLLMPEHAGLEDRYMAATRAALASYGSWWGAYPYGHITVVDPAYESGSGGMEYPTLFTGGARWLAPPESRQPESVTVHEAGHQFWYGLVANDEFNYAWLDEGFNTYSQGRTMAEYFPEHRHVRRYFEGFIPIVFHDLPASDRTSGADAHRGFTSVLKRDPMARSSWTQGPEAYGVNSYAKPALMLKTLENHLGWETFRKVMATYFERWKFRHPRPEDFFAVVDEVSGRDLSWFFDETWRKAVLFDYAVESVRSTRVRSPRGWVETPEGLELQAPGREDGEARHASTVFVRRWGEGVFPIDVRVTFADGSTVRETWDGQDRWTRFDYVGASEVARVEVDPDRVLVLDVNATNNSWVRDAPARQAASKWASRWMMSVQHLMEAFAFFS